MAQGAERQLTQQSTQQWEMAQPVMGLLSGLIRDALQGNVEKFAQMPIAQRKGSMIRGAGARQKEHVRQRLAGQGLERTNVGQAALEDVESRTSSAVMDAIFSEMDRYLGGAQQFGLGLTQLSNVGMANAAQIQAQREAQRRQGGGFGALGGALGGIAGAAIGTFLLPGIGTAAGSMLGSALGTAAGGMIGGSM